MNKELLELISSSKLNNLKVKEIIKLKGDASSREYFRVIFTDLSTVIITKLFSSFGPLSSNPTISQTDSFVQVQKLFTANNIRVPVIYQDLRDKGYLIVEDIGNDNLWSIIEKSDTNTQIEYFKKTIDLIFKIKQIKEKHPLLKREILFENHYEESYRLIKYNLSKLPLLDSELLEVDEFLKLICKNVTSQQLAPIHRDFMAWNIHLIKDELVIIDFQDFILGPEHFDIISLLHDRDTDLILETKVITESIKYYLKIFNLESDILKDYANILLQRNFRLAGQFLFLTEKTGKEIYKSYVPGCLTRAASLMNIFYKDQPANAILSKYLKDFKVNNKLLDIFMYNY